MNKRNIGIILGISILVIFVIIAGNLYYPDHNKMEQTFFVDAVYFDDKKFVKITFDDRSKKSSHIVMEILGMPQSFHKEFYNYSFVEEIPFESVPVYGWDSMPVTFMVNHTDFGQIIIKTEIHSNEEPVSNIVFGKP